ncbi:MAG: hypothetical protein KDE19_12215 [Caldilineaceae bacterium]|nr:hypothetical protein [Caldilineaceae bacterium]
MTNLLEPQMLPQAHLTEEQLLAIAFDASTSSATERDHLAQCPACQATVRVYQALDRELLVAKLSQLSAAAQERYQALFATARVNATSIADRFAQFADAVKASVMWNGHARLATGGVRNASTTSYRMLYGTELAEIELMIEPVGHGFRIEGELLPLQSPEAILPIWLELYQVAGSVRFSGESDSEGRFHIPPMEPGAYMLYLLPPQGTPMLIDTLELA